MGGRPGVGRRGGFAQLAAVLDRPEDVRGDEVPDLPAERLPGVLVVPEVLTGVDATAPRPRRPPARSSGSSA